MTTYDDVHISGCDQCRGRLAGAPEAFRPDLCHARISPDGVTPVVQCPHPQDRSSPEAAATEACEHHIAWIADSVIAWQSAHN